MVRFPRDVRYMHWLSHFIIRGLFKEYSEFCVFSKTTYIFMNIYFVPFKVIPIRYYIRFFPILDALQKIIFYDLVQLLLWCRLYLLNRSITSSFHGPPQFREQEKVIGGQIWGMRWLRQHYCVIFGQKFAHKQLCMSRSVIMVQKSIHNPDDSDGLLHANFA